MRPFRIFIVPMASEETLLRLFFLLQSSDSAYPTGSFAHSFGMEGLYQLGVMEDIESVRKHMVFGFIPLILDIEIPMLSHAYTYTKERRWGELAELDRRAAAMQWSAELRRASSLLGRRRMEMLREVFLPEWPVDRLAGIEESLAFYQAPVVAGVEGAVLGITRRVCAAAFAYEGVRSRTLSAMKLLRLGQVKAHRLIWEAMAVIGKGLDHSLQRPLTEVGSFFPTLEVGSFLHTYPEARQFLS